jgi:hypothetical protein
MLMSNCSSGGWWVHQSCTMKMTNDGEMTNNREMMNNRGMMDVDR